MPRTAVVIERTSPEEAKRRRQCEVDDAMRALVRAEQIKKDPKLMADVRMLAADLKRVAGREPMEPKKGVRREGKR